MLLFSSGMMLLMKGEIGDWASWFGLKLVQLISLLARASGIL
jgi:hypothetical protein